MGSEKEIIKRYRKIGEDFPNRYVEGDIRYFCAEFIAKTSSPHQFSPDKLEKLWTDRYQGANLTNIEAWKGFPPTISVKNEDKGIYRAHTFSYFKKKQAQQYQAARAELEALYDIQYRS